MRPAAKRRASGERGPEPQNRAEGEVPDDAERAALLWPQVAFLQQERQPQRQVEKQEQQTQERHQQKLELPAFGIDLADVQERFPPSRVGYAAERQQEEIREMLFPVPRRFARRRMKEEAFDELADAYFGHIPAIFRRPNSRFFEWLDAARRHTPVKGIVFAAHPWCDLWRAELPRIRAACARPVLSLGLAGEGSAEGAWTTRIQAFLEMLA